MCGCVDVCVCVCVCVRRARACLPASLCDSRVLKLNDWFWSPTGLCLCSEARFRGANPRAVDGHSDFTVCLCTDPPFLPLNFTQVGCVQSRPV